MSKKTYCFLIPIVMLILLTGCRQRETREPDVLVLPFAPTGAADETSPPQAPPERPSAPELWGQAVSDAPAEEELDEIEPAISHPKAPAPQMEPAPELESGPVPSSVESPWNVDELRIAVQAELETCTGKWALYWKCLETDESFTCTNPPGEAMGEQPMVAASLIKLFVAGAYFDAVEQGLLEAAPELVRPMITESSNEACNQLIDLLGDGDTEAGKARVNTFAASIDCPHSQLNRKMLEQVPVENYTSVTDCARVLEMICNGTFVSPEVSEELLGYLKQQTRVWKIPAGLPDGIETANKTGELAGVENDAAVVWVPGYRYILCIMSEDILSPSAGQYNISNISRMIYEAAHFQEGKDVITPEQSITGESEPDEPFDKPVA